MGDNCARKRRQWYTLVSHFYPVWQEQCHGSETSTYCLQSCTHTVVGYLVHDNNFRSAVSMYMSSWHALFDDGRSVTNLFVREMQTNEIHEKSIFLPFWCLLVPPPNKRHYSSVLQKSAMLYMYIMSCKTCYNQRTWRSLPGRASRIDRYAHFFFARKGSFYPFILSFRQLTGRPGMLECAWRMAYRYRRTMPY